MYISVKHIDIKSAQDYTGFYECENQKRLIICDGIGSFKQSGEVAKLVVDNYIEESKKKDFNASYFANKFPDKLKEKQIEGGTTYITASIKENTIDFNYLGNGGIIHLKGDFFQNSFLDIPIPYRYIELMNPDISSDGALTRHISHNSGEQELSLSKIIIIPNSISGDIFILFSDGISSLEEHIIRKEKKTNFLWRYESNVINIILEELDRFIKNNINSNFEEHLIKFNEDILNSLKEKQILEDDASLGFIITPKVLEYYKSLNPDDK